MYKLITSARKTVDLFIGFDRSCDRRKQELTNNKNIKGKYHIGIYLKDIFGSAESCEKGTYGLGYISILTRNTDNAVLNKHNTVNIAKFKINSFEWYVPQYTPRISHNTKISNQFLSKTPTELRYVERSVFMKEVNTQNFWTF